MKLQMISQESGETVMEIEAPNLTDLVCQSVKDHTEQFGEEYLFELLQAIGNMLANGEKEYQRREFSDPEANFDLKLIN